jgi:hypothetical protein
MNYNKLRNTYIRLIGKYDQRSGTQRIQLIRNSNTTMNASTGEYNTTTQKPEYIEAVVVSNAKNLLDGQLAIRGDLKIVCYLDVAPIVGDYVKVDGIQYTILEPILTHNPGGIILGYELQVKR